MERSKKITDCAGCGFGIRGGVNGEIIGCQKKPQQKGPLDQKYECLLKRAGHAVYLIENWPIRTG